MNLTKTDTKLNIECSLYYDDNDNYDDAIYSSNITADTGTEVTVPPQEFHNHTGKYEFICVPKNPAGIGPTSKIVVNLFEVNDCRLYHACNKSN